MGTLSQVVEGRPVALNRGTFGIITREEQRAMFVTVAADLGGRLKPLHAVSMLTVWQPCRQALCEFSIVCLPWPLCLRPVCGGRSTKCLNRVKSSCFPGRQVHPQQVRNGHGHGALPSDRAKEGQGERGDAIAGQGGVRRLLPEKLLIRLQRIYNF
jgi:hypothetical protein